MTIKTPKWMMEMTDKEYKAYVEKGEFPERLKPMLKKEKKEKPEGATAA